jgi:hypothetical protein
MTPGFGGAGEYPAVSMWRKRVLFSILGALAGYAYYYFIGCRSGTCPITGNPWISTAYGGGMGLLMATGERKPKQREGVVCEEETETK